MSHSNTKRGSEQTDIELAELEDWEGSAQTLKKSAERAAHQISTLMHKSVAPRPRCDATD